MTSVVETELTKATFFKPPKGGYDDRQDHLAALARAAAKLSDEKFDELTDDAANWVSTAVKALNNKAEITDFKDAEVDEEAAAEASAESDNEAEEAAAEAKPKKGSKKVAEAKEPKKPEKVTNKVKKEKVIVDRYDNLTGERDRYGIVMGTKTHDAILLYEKGITTGELKEKLNGRFYNILKTLSEKGHRVEKLPGGIVKLTHLEDISAKKGKK